MTTSPAKASLVSLVIPMFNEIDNVRALVDRYEELIRRHDGYAFELVAIDDGSNDGTPAALSAMIKPGHRATIVELARNFGSHQAVSAGLNMASGDCAIVLGADLQEPPELVDQFLQSWQDGYDVVWGIRRTRAQRGLSTLMSRVFSKLFHRYSEIKTYPVDGPSGVLVSRVVLDRLAELLERNRNVYGLIAWLGFQSAEVRYDQLPRRAGRTKGPRGRLFRLAIDSVVEFSSAPLKAATITGFLIAALGFAYAIFLAIRAVVVGTAPEGWTTVTVVLLVLGGIQLLMMGVIGEYLWRTADEARRRPVYVVKNVRRLGS